jgi:hypothetical protein
MQVPQSISVPTHLPWVQVPVWQGSNGLHETPSLAAVATQETPSAVCTHWKELQRSSGLGLPAPSPPGHWIVLMMLQLPWTQKPVLQPSPQRVPFSAVTQAAPEQVWHGPQAPPHGSGSSHSPQSMVVLQLVMISPQLSPQVVVTVHPQTLGVPPPPQVFGS